MPRSPSPDRRDRDHRREDSRDHHRDRRRGRSRSRSRSPRPRRRSSSSSGSRHRHRRHRRRSTSSYGSSESEDERRRRRRRKDEGRDKGRDKERRSGRADSASRSRSRSRSRDRRETKEERRERKRLKREKKEKKKAKKDAKAGRKAAIGEYGKYGIISEADMFSKDQEYRAWLVEEKMLNPETVAPSKMKELFKVYMEDFNTGTLPHVKYYALEAYERRMNAIKAGETLPDESSYDFRADELALSSASRARASKVATADSYLVREQVEALRKLERERTEASRMKRMGMDVKESMGVRYE